MGMDLWGWIYGDGSMGVEIWGWVKMGVANVEEGPWGGPPVALYCLGGVAEKVSSRYAFGVVDRFHQINAVLVDVGLKFTGFCE
jgi:hypothetical protein